MNIFERASKQKLRFGTGRGLLSVEEVWELSLTALDALARRVNKELKETDDESFIDAKTTVNTELNLKMDILKHIIKHKLELKEAASSRAEKKARLTQLKTIYQNKANEELEGLSKEDLAKQIAELEA